MIIYKSTDTQRYGDPYFPVQRRLISLHDIRPLVTPHWHDEAELIRILDGSCTCRINLEQLSVSSGDLLFVAPQAIHSISVSPGVTMHAEIYEFHMSFLGDNTADVCAQRYLAPVTAQRIILPCLLSHTQGLSERAETIFQNLRLAYLSKDIGYELRVKSGLLLLMAELAPFAQKTSRIPTVKSENLIKIKKVLEYIEYHYAKTITIEDLAGLCRFTDYYFIRFFKQYTGMSCTEYIRTLRLDKAGNLLIDGQTPQSAASATGFGSLSYFYREFKKLYRMTPREFQDQCQQLNKDEWGIYGQILVPARDKSQK